MSLSNFYFLPFLIIVIIGYALLAKYAKNKQKSICCFLVIMSYGFIGLTIFYYSVILAVVSFITWLSAVEIEKYESKRCLITKISVVSLLLLLGVFKYYNFFIDSVNIFCGNNNLHTVKILLPLGISFYIFSGISYILDVYRNKYCCNKSVLDVFLYMGFFPKLLAGPIVRANVFFEQLPRITDFKLKNLEFGIQIFVIGLFKKMVLADHLSVFADDIFYAPVAYSSLSLFWGVITYSLQIYFDFSGYSDMAIGVAKIFGFEFERNFNYPYLSKSVTEFWKRWHISLSSWLQEYLYYSLGGNRKGLILTYVNLFLTMLIGGLWHGAAWTFVVWGALHGLGLIIHKLFMRWKQLVFGDKKATNIIWNIVSIFITYLFSLICWIFFRASDFDNAFSIIKGIGCNQDGIWQPYTWTFISLILLIIASIIHINRKQGEGFYMNYPIQNLSTIRGQIIFLLLIGVTVIFAYVGNTAFIYGNF